MAIEFSSILQTLSRGNEGSVFSVKSLNLKDLGKHASPVVVLDDFRIKAHVFGPHPHAGFSAVTYVLEDSLGGARSRDSLGNDVIVGPGGIVWTQAGSGAIHEEMPAEQGRELHGLQIFVNLSAKNKLVNPQVSWLNGDEVPEWRNEKGDRVKIVVGSYLGVTSPLAPAEPFTLLDINLGGELTFDLPPAHNAVVYVLDGDIRISSDGGTHEPPNGHGLALSKELSKGQGLAVFGNGGRITFDSIESAPFVVLSGAEISDPVFEEGSYIMNDRAQIEAAIKRYQTGKMGHLAPIIQR